MRIQAAHLRAIEDHARRGYPDEVCGVLVGRRESEVAVEDVVPVENREREAPRVRYQIAPEDLLRIQRESRASHRDVVGFYHSHPDHPARPSEFDRECAWGFYSYIIVSIIQRQPVDMTCWVLVDQTRTFQRQEIIVGD